MKKYYQTTMIELEVVEYKVDEEKGQIKINFNPVKMTLDFSIIDAYVAIKLENGLEYTQIITQNGVFITNMEYEQFKVLYGDILASIKSFPVITIDSNENKDNENKDNDYENI